MSTSIRSIPIALLVLVSQASADRGRHDELPRARVFVTTPDGAYRLEDAGSVQFIQGASPQLTITVAPDRVHQPMAGFGASITESSAAVIHGLAPAARNALMMALFDPRRGNGLSVLRQPIGGSDFVTEAGYTYDDVAPGQTDEHMRHFSIARDEAQILPLLRLARRLNPDLRIIASPWSAPAWMKTNQSLIGGALIDEARIDRAYARYFVEFLRAYERAGVPVYAVTTQNEPQNRNPSGYPGMAMSAARQARFIAVLGPALRRAGLRTKILAYDHNWSMHPNDVAATPPGETAETEYPATVLGDPAAAAWIDGVAYHCYFGDPSRQSVLHDWFPDTPIYFTECSGSRGASDPPSQVFSDTLKWHARTLIIGVTRNWGRTVINWNLALDPSGGPHVGGCATCTGVVTVGSNDSVSFNAEYYTLGHLSRFVSPGARRIASTSFGTTGWNGQIMDVAFLNPDGSTALVVHNQNDDPRSFAVAVGDASFEYTLPGGALATFTWPRSHALAQVVAQIEPALLAVTAVPAGPADPCCAADVAVHAIDDDATTRWSTGAAQAPGQFLQIDLGGVRQVGRIVLDTGAATGDYPRGYSVRLSNDGQHWGPPVASGAGMGQLTSIDLAARRARHVRVTSTASSGSWWSVADLRVYAGSR